MRKNRIKHPDSSPTTPPAPGAEPHELHGEVGARWAAAQHVPGEGMDFSGLINPVKAKLWRSLYQELQLHHNRISTGSAQ